MFISATRSAECSREKERAMRVYHGSQLDREEEEDEEEEE